MNNELFYLISSAVEAQKFSLKMLSNLSKEGGREVDYLNVIGAQNLEILKLLTFIASSIQKVNEQQELSQQSLSSIEHSARIIAER